jgi:hypothetical protein
LIVAQSTDAITACDHDLHVGEGSPQGMESQMGTPIWQASGAAPVDIQINLDQLATGWFTLTAITAADGPTDLKRIDQQQADGNALFRVTPSSDLLFKMQVLCATAPAAPGAGVWLSAQQNGVVLSCLDTSANVMNQNGAGYQAIQLGSVTSGQNQTFNFDIWQ